MQYISDLHLELFPNNTRSLEKIQDISLNLISNHNQAKYLSLAGDIGNLTNNHLEYFLKEITRGPYEKIFYVAGNHEYYTTSSIRMSMDTIKNNLRELANRHQITFLENESVEIQLDSQPIQLLGTTLWSQITSQSFLQMSDASAIRSSTGILKLEDYLGLHQESVQWLSEEINRFEDKPIWVCSHYLPSYECIAPKYKSYAHNSGFATNLNHLVAKTAVWIHGHTHCKIKLDLFGSKIRSNPLGYINEETEFGYDEIIN